MSLVTRGFGSRGLLASGGFGASGLGVVTRDRRWLDALRTPHKRLPASSRVLERSRRR